MSGGNVSPKRKRAEPPDSDQHSAKKHKALNSPKPSTTNTKEKATPTPKKTRHKTPQETPQKTQKKTQKQTQKKTPKKKAPKKTPTKKTPEKFPQETTKSSKSAAALNVRKETAKILQQHGQSGCFLDLHLA